jgi:hypothetical protein
LKERLKRATHHRDFWPIVIAVAILSIYLSPLYILGEDAHIRVHDNLDSNIAWYKVLVRSGELFGPLDSHIPQIINGELSRNALGSEFSGIVWLHALFPTMVAYALSQTLTRVFAFIGMYLLLKDHFIKAAEQSWIRVGVALAFALTPFWPSGMLSTLGMPLALWAFLNIRKRASTWKDWAVLVLLPFYSSFELGFFFFLSAMGLLWLYDGIVKRRWNLAFLWGIVLMTAMYFAVEYRVVASLIIDGEPTSRDEFVSSKLGLAHTIRLAFKNYLFGHTHDMTLHTFVILPVLFLVLGIILAKKERGRDARLFVFLFVLSFVLSVWYAFWFYKGWQPLKTHIHLLTTFNFARYHFLRPLVIYLNFALGLAILMRMGGWWKRVALISLALQILLLCGYNEEIRYRYMHQPSVRQFYAVDEFRKIKSYIGKPLSSYRVASIGLHPAIAQYNGFYTLDTYNNFYPLSYKHQFRKIIAKELDKSPTLKEYYDQWGNRVYLFSAELGKHYQFKKHSRKKIHHLELNTRVLYDMGGRYIFSSVPILNAAEDGLEFMRTFDDPHAAWKIYLYKVKKPTEEVTKR